MDEIMNKMGSYWLGQRANKEMSSAGDDIESLSTSVGDGAKWLVNKLKGKMQKPLAELLQEHDLPAGVGYRDGSELRFDTTVAGTLDKGSLTGVEGLKAKVLVWARVTAVKADAAKVYFAVGIKKSRSREAYEVIRGAITVDEF
uniref:Uncharacterized protein n=1 Tax=Aegilops tauschii TaxID=37682 RepID=N1QXF0_AEGTA